MLKKIMIIGLSFLILSTGCTSSITSEGISTPHGAKSTYKKEASQGEDVFLYYLGLAVVFSAIFLSALKEAYK